MRTGPQNSISFVATWPGGGKYDNQEEAAYGAMEFAKELMGTTDEVVDGSAASSATSSPTKRRISEKRPAPFRASAQPSPTDLLNKGTTKGHADPLQVIKTKQGDPEKKDEPTDEELEMAVQDSLKMCLTKFQGKLMTGLQLKGGLANNRLAFPVVTEITNMVPTLEDFITTTRNLVCFGKQNYGDEHPATLKEPRHT